MLIFIECAWTEFIGNNLFDVRSFNLDNNSEKTVLRQQNALQTQNNISLKSHTYQVEKLRILI
jgi:hypothetical protein